jgi:hypothetical protein
MPFSAGKPFIERIPEAQIMGVDSLWHSDTVAEKMPNIFFSLPGHLYSSQTSTSTSSE